MVADGGMSDVVRHVTLPLLDNDYCRILYHRISDIIPLSISGDMMCAGVITGGRDACQVGMVTVINTQHNITMDTIHISTLNVL